MILTYRSLLRLDMSLSLRTSNSSGNHSAINHSYQREHLSAALKCIRSSDQETLVRAGFNLVRWMHPTQESWVNRSTECQFQCRTNPNSTTLTTSQQEVCQIRAFEFTETAERQQIKSPSSSRDLIQPSETMTHFEINDLIKFLPI